MRIDRSLCIGAATCVAMAPKAWTLDDEAKAIILDTSEEETDEALLEAAKSCPVMAIFCLLYTSPSPRDRTRSRMPSSA